MGVWTGSSLVQTMACHLLSTNPDDVYGPVNCVLLGSDNGLSLAQHQYWCSIWACELGPPWFRQWPVTCSAPILVMYMGLWTGSSLVQTMACHLLSTNPGDIYGPVNWVLLGSDNGLSLAQLLPESLLLCKWPLRAKFCDFFQQHIKRFLEGIAFEMSAKCCPFY